MGYWHEVRSQHPLAHVLYSKPELGTSKNNNPIHTQLGSSCSISEYTVIHLPVRVDSQSKERTNLPPCQPLRSLTARICYRYRMNDVRNYQCQTVKTANIIELPTPNDTVQDHPPALHLQTSTIVACPANVPTSVQHQTGLPKLRQGFFGPTGRIRTFDAGPRGLSIHIQRCAMLHAVQHNSSS